LDLVAAGGAPLWLPTATAVLATAAISVWADVLAAAGPAAFWLVAGPIVRGVVVHPARQILVAIDVPSIATVLIFFVAVALTRACTRVVNLFTSTPPLVAIKLSVSFHDQPPCMMRVRALRRRLRARYKPREGRTRSR
jgi:hypothetical protein